MIEKLTTHKQEMLQVQAMFEASETQCTCAEHTYACILNLDCYIILCVVKNYLQYVHVYSVPVYMYNAFQCVTDIHTEIHAQFNAVR